MLQRVQTYYLGLIILIQVFAISGLDFLKFNTEENYHVLNAWGMTTYPRTDNASDSHFIPAFIGFIAIAMLSFLCIMAYKNLDRQMKLGRTIFYVYFVSVVSIYLVATFGSSFLDEEVLSKEVGLPYWIFICGLPLSFLANTGIKRDKRILDSLKRI